MFPLIHRLWLTGPPREAWRGLLLGLLAAVLATSAGASHRVRLIGAGDERGLQTYRSISKITAPAGTVYVDKSLDGLRVGQLRGLDTDLGRAERGNPRSINPEDRVSVVRPVFADTIRAVRGWRVVEVVQRTFLTNTTLFRVLDPWSAGTSPQAIFDINKESAAITQAQLVALFQSVLDGDNRSTATNGIYLSGTSDLRVPSTQPLLFDVLLEAPLSQGQTPDSTSVHPVIPVTAAAEVCSVTIGSDRNGFPVTQQLNFVAFRSSFKGTASVFVLEASGTMRPLVSNIPVVPGVTYRTSIRNEFLAAGSNQIRVGVFDQNDSDVSPDLRARGFSGILTMSNPPSATGGF